MMRHIISILVENESGALSRIAGLFSARGYNIESLTVAPTDDRIREQEGIAIEKPMDGLHLRSREVTSEVPSPRHDHRNRKHHNEFSQGQGKTQRPQLRRITTKPAELRGETTEAIPDRSRFLRSHALELKVDEGIRFTRYGMI